MRAQLQKNEPNVLNNLPNRGKLENWSHQHLMQAARSRTHHSWAMGIPEDLVDALCLQI